MKFLYLSIFTLLFFTCTEGESESEVSIRIENVSDYDYQSVLVNAWDTNVQYGDVKSGETTDYQSHPLAYRYAFVRLSISGDTTVIQPIDFVGETPLSPGRYTYAIDADDSQEYYGRLTMELITE